MRHNLSDRAGKSPVELTALREKEIKSLEWEINEKIVQEMRMALEESGLGISMVSQVAGSSTSQFYRIFKRSNAIGLRALARFCWALGLELEIRLAKREEFT